MMVAEDVNFRVGGLTLSGQRWGTKGGRPVLALHGWLDNSGSFDCLAPLLDACDVVCLDGAGHGHSDHRTHLGAYNIWQDVPELFAVADQLGWSEFALLGHSRGAMVAFLAAGTFPARIRHLVMIEGACPGTAEAESTAPNLAESIRMLNSCTERKKSVYSRFEDAVSARVRGLFPVATIDAASLAQRGVGQVEGGFSWCYDPKLMVGSEVKLTEQQVDSFYRRIRSPCLLILAEQGLLAGNATLAKWLESKPEWSVITLPGGHHLHMSEQSNNVAAAVNMHLEAFP